jgi:hypothetical protein
MVQLKVVVQLKVLVHLKALALPVIGVILKERQQTSSYNING